MARYAPLIGKRVEVHYRAGDVYLPATGTLVADTGKSIFLEEQIRPRGRLKTFRWEIPYPYVVQIVEISPLPAPPASAAQPETSTQLDAQTAALGLLSREEKA